MGGSLRQPVAPTRHTPFVAECSDEVGDARRDCHARVEVPTDIHAELEAMPRPAFDGVPEAVFCELESAHPGDQYESAWG
jgi:hypothetical protein